MHSTMHLVYPNYCHVTVCVRMCVCVCVCVYVCVCYLHVCVQLIHMNTLILCVLTIT